MVELIIKCVESTSVSDVKKIVFPENAIFVKIKFVDVYVILKKSIPPAVSAIVCNELKPLTALYEPVLITLKAFFVFKFILPLL